MVIALPPYPVHLFSRLLVRDLNVALEAPMIGMAGYFHH